MNRSRAEGILGFGVDVVRTINGWTVSANWEQGTETVFDADRNDAIACLVDRIYHQRCAAVAKRAGYRCENCGQLGPGQVHHKVFRSQGRDDRMENLEFLDAECHNQRHGIKRSRG